MGKTGKGGPEGPRQVTSQGQQPGCTRGFQHIHALSPLCKMHTEAVWRLLRASAPSSHPATQGSSHFSCLPREQGRLGEGLGAQRCSNSERQMG